MQGSESELEISKYQDFLQQLQRDLGLATLALEKSQAQLHDVQTLITGLADLQKVGCIVGHCQNTLKATLCISQAD